ncbi:MAG: type II 3-dehydroquinate dehydratase [Clostridiales bacterium]|nr:type II 3-dehydroquinate dehydratase [Clostridiales bacterium]
MKIKVINGPNINMIGIREPQIYGNKTYKDLVEFIQKTADDLGVTVDFFQSNSEGDIVTEIQSCYQTFDAIVINPAAYTHTSVAILDALKSVNIPTVEVHLSDVTTREDFRQISFVRLYAEKTIMGLGFEGYAKALEYLVNK